MGSQGTTALTLDDFLALCEAAPDGVRYEAVGGRAVMMSAPTGPHQRALSRLTVLLAASVPGDEVVLQGPLAWVLWQVPSLTLRRPDLAVVTYEQSEQDRLLTPPLLVVEVLSPTTRVVDRRDKRAEYARAGARHYWIVDLRTPSVEALTLDPATGTYRLDATAEGHDPLQVSDPFPVTVVPADLAR
jgi:Uma2 family endonuclease